MQAAEMVAVAAAATGVTEEGAVTLVAELCYRKSRRPKHRPRW